MSVVVGDSSHSFASAPNAAINHQQGIEYDCPQIGYGLEIRRKVKGGLSGGF
jgi:hypothetical protein